MHALILVLSVLAFACLAAAISRHGQLLLRRALSSGQQYRLRLAGWLLLLLTGVTCGLGWPLDIGLIVWLGWLTLAGLVLVLAISYWPGQPVACPTVNPRRQARAEVLVSPQTLIGLPDTAPSIARGTVRLVLVLVLPPTGFSWMLQQVPVPPLQRQDAVHGQLGAWTYVLAETHADRPPEAGAQGRPEKSFTLRFCDLCNSDIQTLQLSLGKPSSARRAGTPFTGRGADKIAVLTIPERARADDDLWLTVTDFRGQVHQQSLSLQRLSPVLYSYLATRSSPTETKENSAMAEQPGRSQPQSADGG